MIKPPDLCDMSTEFFPTLNIFHPTLNIITKNNPKMMEAKCFAKILPKKQKQKKGERVKYVLA